MARGKVVVRVKGGLGNQLFCYAAARRLALVNDAELVIDDVTGFARDRQYHRQYLLDRFRIRARKATAAERLEPFERYRRGVLKWMSRRKPFEERRYLTQEGLDFDARLLAVKVESVAYLDGLWQSEGYFVDVKHIIRRDLANIPAATVANDYIAHVIRDCEAVAIHVRWFDPPGTLPTHTLSSDYYRRGVGFIREKVESPRFFVFSDDPPAARALLALPEGSATFISHNHGYQGACADFWLMTQCTHFIIANSTFSWWGAWLGTREEKIVVAPDITLTGKAAWGFRGLIPDSWLLL